LKSNCSSTTNVSYSEKGIPAIRTAATRPTKKTVP